MGYKKVEAQFGNFTVLEFDTKKELEQYKEEHGDIFLYVGSCEREQPDGKWRLVF